MNSPVIGAFHELGNALRATSPMLVEELRPPVKFSADFLNRPGAEQLAALWSITSGQRPGPLGILGGLRLLGPIESQLEMQKWRSLMTSGIGLEAIAQPVWDPSKSLDPNAVRAVYFAAGWIPILSEPFEANYLAVDLVPLPAGRPGQIVLCGRDEDEKCVAAPDLAWLLRALAAECRDATWQLRSANPKGPSAPYVERRGGRMLTAFKCRNFGRRSAL
jgi:cell wall assembly regulator SMI1